MNAYKIITIFFMYMVVAILMSALAGSFIGILTSITTWILVGEDSMFFIGITAGVVTFVCGCCLGLFLSLPQTMEDYKEEKRKENEIEPVIP